MRTSHRWIGTVALIVALIASVGRLSAAAGAEPESTRSAPPDTTPYMRLVVPEDTTPLGRGTALPGALPPRFADVHIVDVVVNNTDPTLVFTDMFNDGETSIAVNPRDPKKIVISAFSGLVGGNAPLWHTTDGGTTWTKEPSVPPAPGVPLIFGCLAMDDNGPSPCDQTFDYGRANRLAGTILSAETNVYSGLTTNPADPSAWVWNAPGGVTQTTNSNNVGLVDQPWLLVNRTPESKDRENVYVAYDDFTNRFNCVNNACDMRVAVAQNTPPLDFTLDNLSGIATGSINPGHRLAVDRRTGFVYSLFQRNIADGHDDSKNIDYMLNRSINGGRTWSLNGSATGMRIANADSTQPTPKFCTVNALLGGVLHAAVDPHSGDVFYVYGNRDSATGNNRLALRRIVDDGSGNVVVGEEHFVTGQVQAALPSVAVADDGTVGIFYYTCDGVSPSGFPVFTAPLTLTNKLGATFTDLGLLTFLSSATDDDDPRQRVLGDYMQTKTLENTFYGAFTGNGVVFGRPFANHDPIFFRVSVSDHRHEEK
jgi:hypothetical protein